MWSERIRSTSLMSSAAEWFFQNELTRISLSDDRSCTDASMLSTLRFLLHGKTGNGCVWVGGYNPGCGIYDSTSSFYTRLRRLYQHGNQEQDSFLLMVETYLSAEELKPDIERAFGFGASEGNMLPTDSVIPATVPINDEPMTFNLKYQPNLTYFFGTKFGVYVFSDVERRITAVFTSRLNFQKYHWMQAVIPMLMPWYWADGNGSVVIEPESLALLETLNSTDKDKYLRLIGECAEKLEIEDKYNTEMLRGFLVSAQEKTINNAKSDVDDMRRRIQEYMQAIGDYSRQINDKLAYIMGLEMATDNAAADEFSNYIKGNRSIKTVDFSGSNMTILCHGFFEYYNTEPLEGLLESRRSYVYRYAEGTRLEGDKIKKLLKAIFIDQVLRLRVCALYRLDVNSSRVRAIPNATYPSEFSEYFPNPHIEHHGCMGDYELTMAQYIKSGNYVGVVEQCIASAQTMNFYDSTVGGELVQDLARNYEGRNCIMLPDGSFTTVKKALEYLDGQAQE